MSRDPIVAIALLTQGDLRTLGNSFQRAFPINDVPCFEELLRKLDDAEADSVALASPWKD